MLKRARSRYLDSSVPRTEPVATTTISGRLVLEMSMSSKSRLTATTARIRDAQNVPSSQFASSLTVKPRGTCLATKQGQLIGHPPPPQLATQRPRVKRMDPEVLADRQTATTPCPSTQVDKGTRSHWLVTPVTTMCCTAVDSSSVLSNHARRHASRRARDAGNNQPTISYCQCAFGRLCMWTGLLHGKR